MDKPLGDLLVQLDGDAQKYLVTVLDFLKRKSNFFKHGDAKKRVLEAYKEVSGEAETGMKGGFFASPKQKVAAGATTGPAPQVAASPAPGTPAASMPAAAQQAQPLQQPKVQATPSGAPDADVADSGPSDQDEAGEQEHKPKGLKPNSGRGADLGSYSWTQTLSEVTVVVPMPAGVKAKQLDVVIGRQKLKIGVKGQPPVLDGLLAETVKADDCLWNFADGAVELTLTKGEGMHWWRSVMQGDPEIDTQQVEPENSKLTDLDPETRTTVEKMMFDQRQKALGLPTSEEQQKQEMLKRFMAAHPEMDFSQAKIM